MNISQYPSHVIEGNMMGPSCLEILAELLEKQPLSLKATDTVLDLGCGRGLTSYALAKETGAKVCACDLWIAGEDNAARFEAWGIQNQITPCQEDACALPFAPGSFQALTSVDAFHYFGGDRGFFAQKILPLLTDGAVALIGVPGMKEAYAGRATELLRDWLMDEAFMFMSPGEWKERIGSDERIASVETWEMDCFERAWQEWFATGHRFAQGDQRYYESLIKPYTSFVGMCIKVK